MSTSRPAMTMSRTVAWTKDDPIGVEFALVELRADSLSARGVAIGSDPGPYRLDYELETAGGFVTTRFLVAARGDGWYRRLELRRAGGGIWTAEVAEEGEVALPDAGGDVSIFESAIDPDLGLSPLTNTMPVLRCRLHEGGSADDFLMLWVSVPDLSFHPSPQRYTYLEDRSADEHVVRFEAVGEGDDFVADVVFDADGLVLDYPGIASRIRPNESPS